MRGARKIFFSGCARKVAEYLPTDQIVGCSGHGTYLRQWPYQPGLLIITGNAVGHLI